MSTLVPLKRELSVNDSKFPTGRIVISLTALDKIPLNEVNDALQRHCDGDWGELVEYDKNLNNEAVKTNSRILSVYTASDGTKFHIITQPPTERVTFLTLAEE